MGTIKDRNGKDLIEAEETKKKWKEYTEELFKKDLNDPNNDDGVVTHPEPDILVCEVKWALWSTAVNKASGGDGTPAELFKILKNNAIKMLHLISQFSCSVMSNSLRPLGLQHARLPCPSPTPRVYPNSCPLTQWCHPTISSSVVPFSSCLQSLPASSIFKWVSSSHQVAKVLESQLQHQSF